MTLHLPLRRIAAVLPRRRMAAILFALGLSASAHADQADIGAAARGVVRVAIVATDGTDAYFVGHGSGVAVAPDKVLTNAHVVELTRQERNLVIGVIPSEGRQSYGGTVVAYSPGNDLALIRLKEGRLPPGTFYSGPAVDGEHVTAIGYPGAVDRAQGLGLKDLIEPQTTVKTSGTISSGRSGKQFDTILHTAPMAAGNSGGPLVDDCGRILGLNSFGSVSDGNDAEFGFAVSNREIASFLRQAGVPFLHTGVQCRSIAEQAEAEAQRSALEAGRKADAERATQERRDAALARARDTAEQDVISGRENAMAGAAVLLALAVLALGASGLTYTQGRQRPALWFGAGGGAMLLGAILLFFLKPSFASIDDRIVLPDTGEATTVTSRGYVAAGDNICRIDQARSRITVSDLNDIPLGWTDQGCANGKMQFLADGSVWTRISAPHDDAAITVNRFDPGSGTLGTDRYLADLDTLDRAKTIRERYRAGTCTGDQTALQQLGRMQADLAAILPPQPNEKLIYHCVKGRLPAPDGAEAGNAAGQ
jgi:S1-C subfamily serine protease